MNLNVFISWNRLSGGMYANVLSIQCLIEHFVHWKSKLWLIWVCLFAIFTIRFNNCIKNRLMIIMDNCLLCTGDKVYLSQTLKTRDGLLSFNNFLSTSQNEEVSIRSANIAWRKPDMVGIVIQIYIDPSILSTPFAASRIALC